MSPTEIDHDVARAQLHRILASAPFRNSRRSSSLLKYVVEEALDGRAEYLKERTIGVEVFGRPSDYDTNADHIVRSAVGDVRRRLAQYYTEPGREAEARIDLQVGSYVPQFRFRPERAELAEAAEPVAFLELETGPPARRRRRFFWPAVFAAVSLLALLLVFVARPAAPRAVERFWGPVLTSPNAVLLCVGGGGPTQAPGANDTLSAFEYERLPFRHMNTSDALALAGLTGFLQSQGKSYRILNRAGATSFKELQSGPFVLIGALNNEWTLRLTSGERFSFERQSNGARILDKQNPSNTAWSVDLTTPIAHFTQDYAIVSRIRDPKSEQVAVIAAGIGSWGTQAAGEFVAHPENLNKLDAIAPAHWERKNLQVVISTGIIRGSSGPPKVLASYFW